MNKLKTPFADLLPPLSTEEFESLKASIKKDGVRDAILIDEDGNILDGHHRYKVDKSAPHRVVKGLSEQEKKAFVYKSNIARRNISPKQKAEIRKAQKKLAKELNKADWTQAQIAEILGVTRQWVSEWLRKPQRKNIPNASNGNGNKTKPHKDARVTIPPEERETVYERVRDGDTQKQVAADYGVTQSDISKIVSKIEGKKSEDKKIREVSLAATEFSDKISVCPIESLVLPDNSIDMIFTDPPYHDEYLVLYEHLSTLAEKVLKPGAYCMVYCGKMFLPDIMDIMSKTLEYVWEYAVFHPYSKSKINKHKIFENWRPILAFKKMGSTNTREWVQDVVRPPQQDKKYHKWQQDIDSAKQYISAYTKPGEVVLDPFVGGGTTPMACLVTGRDFKGYDKDEKSIRATIRRLKKADIQKS